MTATEIAGAGTRVRGAPTATEEVAVQKDENNREVSDDAVDVSPGAENVAAEGGEVTQANPDPDLAEAGVTAEKPQRED